MIKHGPKRERKSFRREISEGAGNLPSGKSHDPVQGCRWKIIERKRGPSDSKRRVFFYLRNEE